MHQRKQFDSVRERCKAAKIRYGFLHPARFRMTVRLLVYTSPPMTVILDFMATSIFYIKCLAMPFHKAYSHIDYFLLDSKLISLTDKIVYHPIVISDHAPLSMMLKVGEQALKKRRWQFDAMLLKYTEFRMYLDKHISYFISENNIGNVNDSVLWEALKAVIRGHMISYVANKKSKDNFRLEKINQNLIYLENAYKMNPSDAALEGISKLKFEYNSILSKCVGSLLQKAQQKYFELGAKPHSLLARQLRLAQASRAIHRIKDKTGKLITSPEEINKCFAKFYQELYQSKCAANQETINEFLTNCRLSKLDAEAVQALDVEITLDEIKTAVMQFPNYKPSGPDGFKIEFYKSYLPRIASLLLRMLKHSKEISILPNSLYQANIAVLLKKDRDPLNMSSYRPISLLQMETKIFTKVMSNRLCNHIHKLIHPDQSGFVPGRHIYANLCLLFKIMYNKQKEDCVVIALDAGKAFDHIEWQFMLSTLNRFGFGSSFINWITIIYCQPQASIITNGEISQPFNLQRGVRQGCSCSPHLFNLCDKVLACLIGANPNYKPIQLYGKDHHLSLFAAA
ncbi:hypothetical protein F2P81_005045 [Scophthalmus maximus]|uniref:Reverse transcriptase domain-containing protein n=1 Tax=Scophthalmus maximus TaxID=52904 RepID=A0A6A4TGX8_SCOMX|nr:hypothetical protein F2P81_005045 [Scophthalmus maximus]